MLYLNFDDLVPGKALAGTAVRTRIVGFHPVHSIQGGAQAIASLFCFEAGAKPITRPIAFATSSDTLNTQQWTADGNEVQEKLITGFMLSILRSKYE